MSATTDTPGTPFAASADLYDAIYRARGKDYQAEAAAVVELARGQGVDHGCVLDVACGTGEHLRHLSATYLPWGVDASPAMLAVARRKLPNAELHEMDMTALVLPRSFDLVTCLFASIGYLPGRDAMRRAIAAMAGHLRHGGVLVLERAVTVERLAPARTQRDEVAVEGGTVVRRTTACRAGEFLDITFDFRLVRGVTERRFRETHRIALYRDRDYIEAIRDAGLTIVGNRQGRLVAVR